MTPEDPPVVTVAEAAAQLNITNRAVLQNIEAGKLIATKPQNKWLIDAKSLERHLESTGRTSRRSDSQDLEAMAQLDAAHRENELLREANDDLRTQLAEMKRRLHHLSAALAEVATADINLDHR